jgi:hypothetical protein
VLAGRSLDDKLAPKDFVTDLVWAARAVLAQPSVALVSIAVWCLPPELAAHLRPDHPVLSLITLLLVLVFMFGWFGAERMFFLLQRDGKKVTSRDLVAATPFFASRYVSLGVLVCIVAVPLTMAAGSIAGRVAGTSGHLRAAPTIVVVPLIVAIDLALTFVTSALAFTTRSAYEAVRIGLSMIRQTWPRSGLYVLCPPLALNMFNYMHPTHTRMLTVASTAALAVLALLAKGATAAFYLRERGAVPGVATRLPSAPSAENQK